MIYAILNNQKTKASKGINQAVCECCERPVKSFCGKINIDHFRHITKEKCDNWEEPMSKWHIDWQFQFKEPFREVIITKDRIKHRADILNNKSTVIEFQNSYICPDEIRQRERFYNRMIWVFNGIKFRNRFSLRHKFDEKIDIYISNKSVKGYNWLYPKKHIFVCEKPVFLDFGTDYLYYINFNTNKQPKFHSSSIIGCTEYYDSDGQKQEFPEIKKEYHYFPIKLIPKLKFINYYNI